MYSTEEVKLTSVSAGDRHSLAMSEDTKAWGWGAAPQNGLKVKSSRPGVIEDLLGAKLLEVVAGGCHSAAVCERVRIDNVV